MDRRSPVGTDPTAMFSDLEAVAQRARERAAAELEQLESDTELPADEGAAASVDRAAREARGLLLQEGARALEKRAHDSDAELTRREELGIEAIVLVEGRPALPVQGGDFWPPPEEWKVLESQRPAIRDAIARVGRVEVSGHPDFDWVGTAFIVAPDLVMTNRHVAVEFSRRDGASWRFVSGRAARFDLLGELGGSQQIEFEVIGIVGVHDADDVDLALLRVEQTAGTGMHLPEPLPITQVAPHQVVGRPVYVIGYPAWDGRRNEPEPMRRIFMDVYNVKRLQPGVTISSTSPQTVLRHDSSTLGGNSGSPVIDLETHSVLGLHYGGRYGVGNYAVPLWSLLDDPLIRSSSLNFIGG